MTVDYVFTNRTAGHVWVGCPAFECEIDGTWSMRFDALSGDGKVLRLSSRLVDTDARHGLDWPELVPFRRLEAGATRWHAVYMLSEDVARAVAAAQPPHQLELWVGVLPCPEADLLPVVKGLDVHMVRPWAVLSCAGREVFALEVQELAMAHHVVSVGDGR